MSLAVETALTRMQHALWVVDHAYVSASAAGCSPNTEPGEPILVADALQKAIRVSNRGVKRVGLDTRLFLALMILAALDGRATIARMHELATELLPRETQWELGILTHDAKKGQARSLTTHQIYGMTRAITDHLDPNPEAPLDDEERDRRLRFMEALQDALVTATHVLPHTWTSYAVDESGVWAWDKGRTKPTEAPPVHPLEEDSSSSDGPDKGPGSSGPRRGPKSCRMAQWGLKTNKAGGRSAYYGYALHAMVRVPDTGSEEPKARARRDVAEPLLVEQIAIRAASTDLVEPTIGMIDKVIARGHAVRDLLGDRHYSFKKFERWAQPLWAKGVRPVLDLRQGDFGAQIVNGAVIVAGTPHCSVPQHLIDLQPPQLGAGDAEHETFDRLIAERRRYAMQRIESPWAGNGRTRWRCPARNGTVGCPRHAGSVEAARDNGLPVIDPPEEHLRWCSRETAKIEIGSYFKYQQPDYWGSREWRRSYDRRTFIESVFGNMKNHHTGNIRRGFTALRNQPLVTLSIAAAVVAYNLRELDSWHERASKADPGNPLIALYEAHPLRQRTRFQHGFTMLTAEQAEEIDRAAVAVLEAA